MEPRHVVLNAELTDQFVNHWVQNLSDVTERPDIPVENVQFWMKSDKNACRPRKKKKRYPRPHSVLKGLKGKDANAAFDFAISCNKWCVTFRDDDKNLIDLVDECMVCFWLFYISRLVSEPLYVIIVSPLRHHSFNSTSL